MKKTIIYILAIALMLTSLCACGSRGGIASGTDTTPSQSESPRKAENNNGIISSNDTGTTVPNGTATPDAGGQSKNPASRTVNP